jgi:hypothetical protein
MIVQYRNNQDESDPQDGMVFADSKSLSALLDSARARSPFIAELCGDNGFELVIGIGGDFGLSNTGALTVTSRTLWPYRPARRSVAVTSSF